MKEITSQQQGYRDSLIRRTLKEARSASSHETPGLTSWEVMQAAKSDNPSDWYLDIRDRSRVLSLALLLALPEPADRDEASDQIDAIKGSYLTSYARDHRDWATAVTGRIEAAWGTRAANRPAVVTVTALRDLATGTAR